MFPFSSSIYWGLTGTMKSLEKYKQNTRWLSVFAMNYEEALNRIGVDGLPDTCDERVVLESHLCTARICYDKFMGPVVSLPGAPGGILTGYGYPEEAFLYSANGAMFHKSICIIPTEGEEAMNFRREALGEPTCALVVENHLSVPFLLEVIKFTDWMVQTLESIDIARENSRDEYLLMCEEAVAKSVDKLVKQRERDPRPVRVISTGHFDVSKVQITPTDAAINHLKPLTALYEWYQSQFRQECGRQGVANPDKGERLNIPETQASLNSGIFNVQNTVDYLNKQMDKYNPILGTNIRYKVVEDNAFNAIPGSVDEMAGDDTGDGNVKGSRDD